MLPFALSQSRCPMKESKPIVRTMLPVAVIASCQRSIRRSTAWLDCVREIWIAQGSAMLVADDPGDELEHLRLHQLLVDLRERVVAARVVGAVQLRRGVARAHAYRLAVMPGDESDGRKRRVGLGRFLQSRGHDLH